MYFNPSVPLSPYHMWFLMIGFFLRGRENVFTLEASSKASNCWPAELTLLVYRYIDFFHINYDEGKRTCRRLCICDKRQATYMICVLAHGLLELLQWILINFYYNDL